jgi:sec-independent protein translocase protein TatA
MFDVGGGELLLILVAVLLLFGPSKLPELARSFGKGLAQVRKAQTEFQRNLNAITDEIEETVQDIQKIDVSENVPVDAPIVEHTMEPALVPVSATTVHSIQDSIAYNTNENTSSDALAIPPVTQTAVHIRPADGAIAHTANVLPQSDIAPISSQPIPSESTKS